MAIIVDDGGIISWNNSTYIPHDLDYRPSTRVRLDPVKSAATECHRLLEVDPRLIKSYNTVPIAFRRTVNRLETRHCRKTSWTLPTQQNCPKTRSGSRTIAAADDSVPTANHQNQHLFAQKTSHTDIASTHEGHLVVFITLVGIDTVVLQCSRHAHHKCKMADGRNLGKIEKLPYFGRSLTDFNAI